MDLGLIGFRVSGAICALVLFRWLLARRGFHKLIGGQFGSFLLLARLKECVSPLIGFSSDFRMAFQDHPHKLLHGSSKQVRSVFRQVPQSCYMRSSIHVAWASGRCGV